MRVLSKFVVLVKDGIIRVLEDFLSIFYKKLLGACGSGVMLKPFSSVFKGLENIYISSDVRIARYAVIYSTNAKVHIGPKVDIAPYFKLISGNHRTDVVGHFMFDADYEKLPENDQDVVIEGDNWIGINVTVLSGVTVGRGSVIASGAVLNKSCPPYSIVGGVPARVLKYRFTIDQALEHEKALYPEDKRLTREQLEKSRM